MYQCSGTRDQSPDGLLTNTKPQHHPLQHKKMSLIPFLQSLGIIGLIILCDIFLSHISIFIFDNDHYGESKMATRLRLKNSLQALRRKDFS